MNTVAELPWIQRAFIEGGPVMYVILFIFIITIILIIERFIYLKYATLDKKGFLEQLIPMILKGDIRQAIAFCDSRRAPLSNTIKSGLIQALNKRPDEEIQVAMDAAVLREQPHLEGWSSFLAVTGNSAVLAGLLGTIIGMIQSFRGVAEADPAQKAERLSQGISHALNCTAFGLLVAIVSVIFYGYFQLRIQRLENEIMESSMSVLNVVASNRDKIRD
ncbi:MAG: MotA/TolQ/ExbB proton channel family protein [Bdellovibrionaceae bacterium]|nr:MotA/TolQ/ExbB proton channel family protein [Pseudobdellovibrionaceae bacterium]MDW8189578.1 MotA/TolQ/ExbB proton channel family protein [Pseudobdellovibrionaceae bacterium]